jgi:hypothetical protein
MFENWMLLVNMLKQEEYEDVDWQEEFDEAKQQRRCSFCLLI